MNKAPQPTMPPTPYQQPGQLDAYPAQADPFANPNYSARVESINGGRLVGPGRAPDPEVDLSNEGIRMHPIHREEPLHVGDSVYASHNSEAGRKPRHGTDTLWLSGYNREMPPIEPTGDIAPHNVEPHAIIRGSIRNQSPSQPQRAGTVYYSGRHADR